MIYPIKTIPVYKQYIWGGNTLKTKFGKNIPDGFAAESWEISCHPEGLSSVANGECSGRLLTELIAEDPGKMLGGERREMSLLVKLIDANDRLSVQVHPNDDVAKSLEGEGQGKTEMWYVIDAAPGAKIVYGLREGVGEEEFKAAVAEGRVEDVLNYIPVSAGDSFFIPAGTVHAIGEGILIAEVQQSSNITYRLYDYDRVDKDGNKRPLHTEKALAAIDFSAAVGKNQKYPVARTIYGTVQLLAKCEYFTVVKHNIHGLARFTQGDDKYEIFTCVEGEGKIICNNGDTYDFSAGDSFFIPATMEKYMVEGECVLIRSLE